MKPNLLPKYGDVTSDGNNSNNQTKHSDSLTY